MAFNDLICNLSEAVETARKSLAEVTRTIDQLEQERRSVIQAPPHTSDIVASYMRGLDRAAEAFMERIGSYLNKSNVTHPAAAEMVQRTGGQFLTVEQQPPAQKIDGTPTLFPPIIGGALPAELNAAAVTFFLRDRIAEKIPELIERLCPEAARGLPAAEREAALNRIDAELSEFKAARSELMANIDAARRLGHH